MHGRWICSIPRTAFDFCLLSLLAVFCVMYACLLCLSVFVSLSVLCCRAVANDCLAEQLCVRAAITADWMMQCLSCRTDDFVVSHFFVFNFWCSWMLFAFSSFIHSFQCAVVNIWTIIFGWITGMTCGLYTPVPFIHRHFVLGFKQTCCEKKIHLTKTDSADSASVSMLLFVWNFSYLWIYCC